MNKLFFLTTMLIISLPFYIKADELVEAIEQLDVNKVAKILKKEPITAEYKKQLLESIENSVNEKKERPLYNIIKSRYIKIGLGALTTRLGYWYFKIATHPQVIANIMNQMINDLQKNPDLDENNRDFLITYGTAYGSFLNGAISSFITTYGIYNIYKGLTQSNENKAYYKTLAIKALILESSIKRDQA